MKSAVVRRPASLLLCGLLMLVACGGSPEAGLTPAEESLGTQEAELCSGASVTQLTISGISTYQGEMAGSGNWEVAYPANAVRLDYFVDGNLRGSEERRGTTYNTNPPTPSGTWYFSSAGISCGTHTFTIRAIPMSIDSAGNRATCWDSPREFSQSVTESCPNLAVAVGHAHTLALKQDGTVWAWGYNYGHLGDGTTTERPTPVQVVGLSGVKAIGAGSYHSMALRQDGTVWTWGYNGSGQLGDGTTTDHYTPAMVPGLNGVIAIAAGGSFSLAVKQDGTVWAWGDNWTGPLGDGTETTRLSPVRVLNLNGVKAVAAGINHSVALKQDGTVWTWGRNSLGELGDGTTNVRTTPVQAWGISGVTAISASYWHTMAIKQDGTVWNWGDNRMGQLGDGTTADRYMPVQVPGISNTITVAQGSPNYNTVVMKQDGSGWAWGSGILGNGSTQSLTPVRVSNLP
ncbi:hypothetical protein [Archangium sp.]|uniref:RCC1 domain-containing protein n=1 Tax=Archangium sp. TaxID=1872627 RepID=UPI002D4ED395|nr:hypothetical protein [Archangium sp.]HYO57135.1 hypothetical protein [Archangium sp.]